MREYDEIRGTYNIRCYETEITPLMKKLALDFSTSIILGGNQYDRMLPAQVRDLETALQIRIQRTYVGKLAELAFADLLLYKGRNFTTAGMFQIYEGEENVDSYDFSLRNGSTVDVKCGFRPIHRLLAVNLDQFNAADHKDYYVSVKLNAIDIDPELTLIDMDSITSAAILGYAEYPFLQRNAHIQDLGEGPARIYEYSRLLGIDSLLNRF